MSTASCCCTLRDEDESEEGSRRSDALCEGALLKLGESFFVGACCAPFCHSQLVLVFDCLVQLPTSFIQIFHGNI